MTSTSRDRRSHANLELDSRRAKARKLSAVVGARRDLGGARVLEIGTGAGVIAAELAREVGPGGRVSAIDVVDERQLREGYDFQLVHGVELPFAAGEFDLIVSNHVMEHVGDQRLQLAHLQEIRRLLRPEGMCYLAVPNRWAAIEPHYRLPLLSWLPVGLRDRYLRISRRGGHYDCYPPSRRELSTLVESAGFEFERLDEEVIRLVATIEKTGLVRSVMLAIPGWMVRMAGPLMPTMVLALTPARR